MADDWGLPSLDAVLDRVHDLELIDRQRRRERHIHRARDDWGLVEVGVDREGEVVEVAINTILFGDADPLDLAESMLQAVQAAQRRRRAAAPDSHR